MEAKSLLLLFTFILIFLLPSSLAKPTAGGPIALKLATAENLPSTSYNKMIAFKFGMAELLENMPATWYNANRNTKPVKYNYFYSMWRMEKAGTGSLGRAQSQALKSLNFLNILGKWEKI